MKKIFLKSWLTVSVSSTVFILTLAACSNLFKLKSSNLHQRKATHEASAISQELRTESGHSIGSILQNDSSRYWLWFQSSNPFIFHPDSGLKAEDGEFLLQGSRGTSRLALENTWLQSSRQTDSMAYDKLETFEKNVTKELEKERKGEKVLWFWIVGVGVVVLILIVRRGLG